MPISTDLIQEDLLQIAGVTIYTLKRREHRRIKHLTQALLNILHMAVDACLFGACVCELLHNLDFCLLCIISVNI